MSVAVPRAGRWCGRGGRAHLRNHHRVADDPGRDLETADEDAPEAEADKFGVVVENSLVMIGGNGARDKEHCTHIHKRYLVVILLEIHFT